MNEVDLCYISILEIRNSRMVAELKSVAKNQK